MKAKIAGVEVDVNSDGYLLDKDQWTEAMAPEIAKGLGIELSDKHWQVIKWLRGQVEDGEELSIRKVGKSEIVDIKEFYHLFPGGPLKNACKISGLQKPTSCI